MTFIILFFIVFVANILQVLTGFAGTLLAMPFSIDLIGASSAKALLNVIGLILSIYIVVFNYSSINKKEFFKIISIMLFSMFLGTLIYNVVQLDILLLLYGIMIILIAFKKLFISYEFKLNEFMMYLIIFLSGIIHGMFISGGALLVVYASSRFEYKSEFRATLSAVWIVLNFILMIQHILSGYFDKLTITYTIFSIVPALCSVYLGNLIYDKVNEVVFMKITYVLLLISGLSIVI